MSYPIPHFKEPEDDLWRIRAEFAEAALAQLRRLNGRPVRQDDEPVLPPILTFPVLRELPVKPVLPAFEPSFIPPVMLRPS